MAESFNQLFEDYQRIEQAILFLEKNFQDQPDLKQVAGSVGLSEYHFQRLFTRWAGISPKRFLQFLSIEHAKQLLAESKSILDAAYETGLSSPGRLHDLFVTYEAVTPGEFKRKGEGVIIAYGFHLTPFGEVLLAVTERGICGLSFVAAEGREATLTDLQRRWPQAKFQEDPAQTMPLIEQIFSPSENEQERLPLKLHLKGTNFQIKVWQALLKIPPGRVASYETIAALIDQPTAKRAIGQATGQNPIAYLIPCHRVIRKVGSFGEYQWGAVRKKAILGWEAAQQQRQTSPYETALA